MSALDQGVPMSAEQLLEKLSAVVAELKRDCRAQEITVGGWRAIFRTRANCSTNKGDAYIHSPDGDVIRSVVGLKRKLGVRDAPKEATGAHRRVAQQHTAKAAAVEVVATNDDGAEEEEVEEEGASTASDETAAVHVAPVPPVALHRGARVKGRYCASRLGTMRTFWYPGVVTALHADGTCAIRYDDGDDELVVYPQFVRQLSAEEAAEADAETAAREEARREEQRRKQERRRE